MGQICSETTLLIWQANCGYASGIKLVPVCGLAGGTNRILEKDGNCYCGINDDSTGSN
jgi:hypothetical protein